MHQLHIVKFRKGKKILITSHPRIRNLDLPHKITVPEMAWASNVIRMISNLELYGKKFLKKCLIYPSKSCFLVYSLFLLKYQVLKCNTQLSMY